MTMSQSSAKSKICRRFVFILLLSLVSAGASAQTCLTSSDMDDATRTAMTNAAKQDFDLLSRGDSAGLKQASSTSLAGDFSGVDSVIAENRANLAGATATPQSPFELKADKADAAAAHGTEFLCGIFDSRGQTSGSAEFIIPNLPPGDYGVVILDAASKIPAMVSFVLVQQSGWKLAGLYVKNGQAGRDARWFATKAREYKAKNQSHNAWLYFQESRDLAAPVSFMSTQLTDKLYDEAQAAKPADIPGGGTTVDLPGTGKTFKLTALFPLIVGTDLDLVVKYQAADVSNTGQTFEQNVAVMKALLAKYPEFREAFDGIVARAVEPSGKDYGSLLPMKEIK
jgi:hypothetical protein